MEKAKKDCRASEPKLEALLVSAVEARNKERVALALRVKSRATALGLAK